MKNMITKGNVGLMVAKKGVELAQGGVESFVAPSKAAVLKWDLVQFTSLESVAESHEASTIDATVAFVSCTVNLVEITVDNPLSSDVWLRVQ
jgi:hypothetical protein